MAELARFLLSIESTRHDARGNAIRMKNCRVALVQAAPVIFDTEATLDRIEQHVADASGRGAELVMFPEAYLSGYSRPDAFHLAVNRRRLEQVSFIDEGDST